MFNRIKNKIKKKSNKRSRYFLAGCFALLIVFSLAHKTSAKTKTTTKTAAKTATPSRLSGKILLQVESKGEAWYVKPDDMKRYYLGLPSDAFYIMQELGLGISEENYWNFALKGKFPARLSGKILLRVEEHGEAYYINPSNLEMLYLGTPQDAFDVMRSHGLGIANKDLEKIEIGKSIEAVIEARKHIPVKISEDQINQQNAEARDTREKAREEREKAQNIEDKKNCAYDKGCYLYKEVMIKWVVTEDTFPSDWSAESVTDKDKIDRSIRVLKKGLDKYPEYFFTDKNKGIKVIYALNNLVANFGPAVATVSPENRKIYMPVCSVSEDAPFEQTFHHEYAHLLSDLNYDSFPEKEWDKINPPGFEYNREMEWGGGDIVINRNNGFIRGYSKADMGEDFAVLVESLFKNRSNSETDKFLYDYDIDDLWILKEKYKRIGQKTNLVIAFYHKLDPIFTEEYFRKVGNEQ